MASHWNEKVPPGILSPASELLRPPNVIPATALLPESIPAAWSAEQTSALALAQKENRNLPWPLVSQAIDNALKSNFLELTSSSTTWPCISGGAAQATFKLRADIGSGDSTGTDTIRESRITHALAEYSAAQLQDLVDELNNLISTAASAGLNVSFVLDIRVGTEDNRPNTETLSKLQNILSKVNLYAKLEGGEYRRQ